MTDIVAFVIVLEVVGADEVIIIIEVRVVVEGVVVVAIRAASLVLVFRIAENIVVVIVVLVVY